MTVSIVNSSGGSEALAIIKKFKKDMGDGVAHMGNEALSVLRIPTGILALDVATNGGIPRNRISITWGSEASGKTAIAYLLMAQVQREGQRAVYVDMEGTLDPAWTALFGVNMSDLIVLQPDFAEQAVDMVEAMLYASDVGIVVVDSIAAMTTDNEIASSAQKMIVGGNSYVVGKLVRKSVVALGKGREHRPALFLINQSRYEIGKMFGDPLKFPGGNALKFASSMTLRLYGKLEIEKDVNPVNPTFLHVTGSIQKAKVPVISRSFEYDLTLIPHGNLGIGMSPSWNFVASKCKDIGLMTQAPKGDKEWSLCGKTAKTQKELRNWYETDKAYSLLINSLITKEAAASGVFEIDPVPSAPSALKIDTETGEILSG